jgi:hypothetical protein
MSNRHLARNPTRWAVTDCARPVLLSNTASNRLFVLPFLLLELLVASIVAGRAVMVRAAVRTMKPPVIPSPAIAVPPVLVAGEVAESPAVLMLIPASATALVPIVVSIGSVVPLPVIAVLPILVAIVVAELPCVVLSNPLTLASLVPFVLISFEQARGQDKRTAQNKNSC